MLDPKWWIIAIGAAITVGSATFTGMRLHKALLRYAPRVGILVPPDGGVVLGLITGVIMVVLWLV